VQVTATVPVWLTAEANTACAGKATEVVETLQPALMVTETPSVVVAVPALAASGATMAASRSNADTARAFLRFKRAFPKMVMCLPPKARFAHTIVWSSLMNESLMSYLQGVKESEVRSFSTSHLFTGESALVHAL